MRVAAVAVRVVVVAAVPVRVAVAACATRERGEAPAPGHLAVAPALSEARQRVEVRPQREVAQPQEEVAHPGRVPPAAAHRDAATDATARGKTQDATGDDGAETGRSSPWGSPSSPDPDIRQL